MSTEAKGRKLTLAVIGCGQMARSVLGGILKNHSIHSLISNFIIYDTDKEGVEKMYTYYQEFSNCLTILHTDILTPFVEADIIILGFEVCLTASILGTTGVKDALRGKLVISLLAGIPSYQLEDFIYNDMPGPLRAAYTQPVDRLDKCCIIVATTNLAASINHAMTVINGLESDVCKKRLDIILWIFREIGEVMFATSDEFHVASVLTGASAAFMTIALEGLLDGAVAEGLERTTAQEILCQVLIGMVKRLSAKTRPSSMREECSRPRGIAIWGLMALDALNVRTSYCRAVIDATARAKTQ